MLTDAELQATREKLHTAHALIEDVKGLFKSEKRIESARMMNEIVHRLVDQLCILDREIAASGGGARLRLVANSARRGSV
jgi:hypothetical protein